MVSTFAIDGDHDLRRVVLLVARYIGQFRQCLQLAEKTLRPDIQLVYIRVLQRILVQAARNATADRDVLCRLQVKDHAFHLRELRSQPIDDLDRRSIALVVRLEPDEKPPGIPLLLPNTDPTVATSGSRSMTRVSSRCRRLIFSREAS